MSALASELVLGVFVLFCRVGAAVMLMPGLSSAQIPAQVRLFIAISVTLALAPLLLPVVRPGLAGVEPVELARIIGGELLVGGLIGMLARIFFLALQALATTAASAVGFTGIPSTTIDEAEPVPALAGLIGVTAVVLMFQADLHWELFRGIADSYVVLPPREAFETGFALEQVVLRLSETFLLTLRIASPFIIYAVVVNLAVGIANKLIPQIPIYFVALPAILAGGLFIVWFRVDELLLLFTAGFRAWVLEG